VQSDDLSGFAGLVTQVDIPALTALVNTAVKAGPVSLPEIIGILDNPYLGDVVVLWALAVRQDPDSASTTDTRRVRFQSIDGGDRIIEVPSLVFRQPVAALGEI